MKQIIQDLKKGNTILENVPSPLVKKGHVLIQTQRSLVSLGTEKMLVEFGKSNLISKARQQPEKVKQVLDKIKSEGLVPTLEAVFNKLDEPLPLGYCNAGKVIAVGEDVTGFNIGDRVASNGNHAEVVCVPKNLVVRIPENVSYEEATFTVIGAIGLQGIRLVSPSFGETVVVIGLGLIGLITVELLIANGCNVIGFDFDEHKVDLAKAKGANGFNASKINPVAIVDQITNGNGCDAVIITASTKSNDVISQSAQMSRKKGRIVLVGVVGLDIQRADFFKKELSFQVSCSYGPGRYDDDYELKGIDYPLAYVRWTEKRNFEAILNGIASGKLKVKDLITEVVNLEDYRRIYGNMKTRAIASILKYDSIEDAPVRSRVENSSVVKHNRSKGVIGIVGAGNFTKMTVLPALKKIGADCKFISSAGGLTARSLSKKYGIQYSTTDYNEILNDTEVDLVLIMTRHNLHASILVEALTAGKHVFVEKPLALNNQELQRIENAVRNNPQLSVNVGYNRRFSPHIQKAKSILGASHAINMIATINAGFIPPEVWIHDLKVGGGRIIGEACHFMDLMIYLAGSKIISVYMSALGKEPASNTDNAIITLKFANGSQGVINYFANGNRTYSKERIEIFSQGRTLIIDNFRKTIGYGFKGFSTLNTTIDKGHKNQFQQLIQNIKSYGNPLIPFEELMNSTKAGFAAIESLQTNSPIHIS